jgi:hypothetical protein
MKNYDKKPIKKPKEKGLHKEMNPERISKGIKFKGTKERKKFYYQKR